MNPNVPSQSSPATPAYGLAALRSIRYSSLFDSSIFQTPLFIAGLGAIGHNVALRAAQMGYTSLHLCDFDRVSEENLGPQGFWPAHINSLKTEATRTLISHINPSCSVSLYDQPISPNYCPPVPPGCVYISCIDNMAGRESLFDHFLRDSSAYAFFDNRMAAMSHTILYVPGPDETDTGLGSDHLPPDDAYVKAYRSTLFSDAEGHQAPCTARATTFCSDLAAALTLAAVTRTLNGSSIPFRLLTSLSDFTMEATDCDTHSAYSTHPSP